MTQFKHRLMCCFWLGKRKRLSKRQKQSKSCGFKTFIELFEMKQGLNATVELRQRHNIHRKTNHFWTFQPLLWVAVNHRTKTESILNLTFCNISPILNNTHAAEDTLFTLDETGVIRIREINWEMRQRGDTSCQRRREEELGTVFIKPSTLKNQIGESRCDFYRYQRADRGHQAAGHQQMRWRDPVVKRHRWQ